MDRIIRHITKQLTDLLPDDNPHYRLDELRTWGFPDFIIRRIRVELERNLGESMNLPRTDWANMQSPAIQTVWEQFIEAIRQEARLPASYANTVIETAVADVVDMLIQPRKNLPEVIFGADKELTYDQILDRMDAIAVYRHFAALIPRYMQKKGIEKLTKKRCAEVIASVDDRLTKRYSPLNWAQMLDPLFNLLNQQIDTNLLRLFFEDKKMHRLARQFDRLNSSIDRTQLIEVLSSPESLNMEGYEDDQSELFTGDEQEKNTVQPEKTEETPDPSEIKGKQDRSENRSKREKGSSGSKRPKDTSRETAPGEDPIIGAFHKYRESLKDVDNELEEEENADTAVYEEGQEEVTDTGEEGALNDIFREPDEDQEPGVRAPESNGIISVEEQQEESNITSSAPGGEELTEDDAVETEDTAELSDKPGLKKGKPAQDDDDDEEVPMWKRFLSPEELDALETEEAEEEVEEEEFSGNPPADHTDEPEKPEANDAEADSLRDLLEDNRSYFVDEIFQGSERAYDETVIEIVQKEDWQSASKYIQNEVFKRNLVNMYSEAAVDFTDLLHTYFLKKSKS